MEASRSLAALATPRDIFYNDSDSTLRQSINVEYDTRFVSAFQTLNGGQQVVVIPPGNGLKHAVAVFKFSAAQLAGLAATPIYALQKSWAYELINSVSWRVGGSANYYLTNTQLMQRNFRNCRTRDQREAIYQLGGNQCISALDYASDQYAYVPLSFWSSPSTDSLETPLNTDLLGQQVQLTITLNPISSIFHLANGAVANPAIVPSALDSGYVQVEQLSMVDRGMSLANDMDLNKDTYVQALRSFDQQELTAEIAAGSAAEKTITFSGIMAGQVRSLQVYLTPLNPAGDALANTMRFPLPKSVVAIYAGTQFAVYRDQSSQIWGLMDGTAPNAVTGNVLASAGGVWSNAVASSSALLSSWVSLPFSQPLGSDYEAMIMVSGKQLTNGSVTLQITPPDAAGYVVHVVPVLVGAVAYSRGSANILIG